MKELIIKGVILSFFLAIIASILFIICSISSNAFFQLPCNLFAPGVFFEIVTPSANKRILYDFLFQTLNTLFNMLVFFSFIFIVGSISIFLKKIFREN